MPEIKNPQEALADRNTSLDSDHNHNHGQHEHWKKTNSLGSIVAGGALAVYGISRKNAGGAALAAAGSLLAMRGIRRVAMPETIHVERSFTINRPVAAVFRFFRDFENLPRFMQHLKQVQITGERTSRWVARAPLGLVLEWDAELIEEQPERYLVWQSLPGTVIPNRGSVEFRPASEYHGGTEITVSMEYTPRGGRGSALFARVFGTDPGIQLREDLRRLKQLLEAGEIPTTEGQPHGRRTAFVRMIEAVAESPGHNRRDTPQPQNWAVNN